MLTRLIACKQRITISDGSQAIVSGYMLPDNDNFQVREQDETWVLSINGLMVTYGSLEHCLMVANYLDDIFNWSEADSIGKFNAHPRKKEACCHIISLRDTDSVNRNLKQ